MRSFSQHQMDKSGVPKDDRARAVQTSSEQLVTTYGHLLSHCIEVIGSRESCRDLKEQVINPLRTALSTILNDRFARTQLTAPDGSSGATSGVSREEAREQFSNEAMLKEPDYGAKIAFVDYANTLADNVLEQYYAPQVQHVCHEVEQAVTGYLRDARVPTYGGLWDTLSSKGLVPDPLGHPKAAVFEEIYFALNQQLYDVAADGNTIGVLGLERDALPLTKASVIAMAVEDMVTAPIRRSWSDESLAVKEQMMRGIVVTTESRLEIDDMVFHRAR